MEEEVRRIEWWARVSQTLLHASSSESREDLLDAARMTREGHLLEF